MPVAKLAGVAANISPAPISFAMAAIAPKPLPKKKPPLLVTNASTTAPIVATMPARDDSDSDDEKKGIKAIPASSVEEIKIASAPKFKIVMASKPVMKPKEKGSEKEIVTTIKYKFEDRPDSIPCIWYLDAAEKLEDFMVLKRGFDFQPLSETESKNWSYVVKEENKEEHYRCAAKMLLYYRGESPIGKFLTKLNNALTKAIDTVKKPNEMNVGFIHEAPNAEGIYYIVCETVVDGDGQASFMVIKDGDPNTRLEGEGQTFLRKYASVNHDYNLATVIPKLEVGKLKRYTKGNSAFIEFELWVRAATLFTTTATPTFFSSSSSSGSRAQKRSLFDDNTENITKKFFKTDDKETEKETMLEMSDDEEE